MISDFFFFSDMPEIQGVAAPKTVATPPTGLTIRPKWAILGQDPSGESIKEHGSDFSISTQNPRYAHVEPEFRAIL